MRPLGGSRSRNSLRTSALRAALALLVRLGMAKRFYFAGWL